MNKHQGISDRTRGGKSIAQPGQRMWLIITCLATALLTMPVQAQDEDLYRATLLGMRTSNDYPLFGDWEVDYFTAEGVPLDYIKALLELEDEEGYSLITPWTIGECYVAGLTVEYVTSLLSLPTYAGMYSIWASEESNSLVRFHEAGGTLNFAAQASAIQQIEGELFYYPWQLVRLREAGLSVAEARSLALAVDDTYCFTLSSETLPLLTELSLPEDYARTLTNLLAGEEGNQYPIFDAFDIIEMHRHNLPLSTVLELAAVTDDYGYPFISSWELGNLIPRFLAIGGTVELARQYQQLTDGGEYSVFQAIDVINYLELGGTLDYARQLINLSEDDEYTWFYGWDIVNYWDVGGTPEFAAQVHTLKDAGGEPKYMPDMVAQFYLRGISLEQLLAGSHSVEQTDVYQQLSSQLKASLIAGLELQGQEGLIYSRGLDVQANSGRVALFYDGETNLLPSPEELRGDLISYLYAQLYSIIDEHDQLLEGEDWRGGWLNSIEIHPLPGSTKVTVETNYVLIQGGQVVCIDQLEVDLDFDYSRTCEVLSEAMRQVMSSATQFNSTSMRDIGVYVELEPVDDKQVVIKLSDTKNKLNNRAFVYRFAVYYP